MSAIAELQRTLAQTRVMSDYIQLTGGLDEVTPPYQRKTGRTRAMQNFEVDIHGGYARTVGYERFDGRTAPSSASYGTINLTITGALAAGNTITGVTSAATAVVLAVVTSSMPNYLVVTKITGTFQSGEVLNVGGTPRGTTSSTMSLNTASTPLLRATYKNLAADNYRADIAAIPGSGRVLGVVMHLDVVYGFRNNVGGTAADLYKSTTSGWTAVALGRELAFTSGGTTEIAEGDTITGATSGATAVITRVVLTSGTWAGGAAAGKFIFASQTGTFQAENLNVGASTNLATIAGNSTAITLLPSGRYSFVKENFGGAANTKRVYGADGVNRGFEFDGTVFVPIDTGMTTDTPLHVYAHKQQLFFSFDGSAQHSSPGEPYVWDPIVGASEIGLGDTISGFASQPGSADGGALAIFTRNRLQILYGSGVVDWSLTPYRQEIGAYPYTIQDVGFTMFLDDRGITDLQTSQEYGNFAHNAVSDQIRNRVNSLRLNAIASCISRDKSQYRLFCTTGEAIYITLKGRSIVGITPMLFPDVARCVWSGEQASGAEVTYFGSDDGYVYQMERGTSYDGDAIEAYMNLAYNFQKAPRAEKHYHDCTAEVSGNGYAAFELGYSLGYGSSDIPQPASQSVVTNYSSVYWDSFTWDAFVWDGVTLSPNTIDIDGDAENISLAITSSSDIYDSFTVTAMLLHYSPRGRLRA